MQASASLLLFSLCAGSRSMRFETQCVHGGVHKDQQYNSVTTPIYPSSTFSWSDTNTNSGYDYTRSGNPTRKALEENLAALEGGAGCVATSSGMSAIHCAMSLFSPGDHIVVPVDVYGGTFRLFDRFLSEKGLKFSFVDMTSPDTVRAAVTPATRCLWIETPAILCSKLWTSAPWSKSPGSPERLRSVTTHFCRLTCSAHWISESIWSFTQPRSS